MEIGRNEKTKCRNPDEFKFYFAELMDLKFIKPVGNENLSSKFYTITPNGIEHYEKISNEGQLSKNCFIAMSFGKTEEWIYKEGIFPALEETNFNPIKVNELDSLNDRIEENTVNDLIIASLKKSKFCIADFTENKNGVYFEAGYALGHGRKVIYTCVKNQRKNIHFNVNHFPIIHYENGEELKVALIDAINARILE